MKERVSTFTIYINGRYEIGDRQSVVGRASRGVGAACEEYPCMVKKFIRKKEKERGNGD
jgi:hypothetical protein